MILTKMQKSPSLFFLVKAISRILTRDYDYINFALYEYADPKCFTIQTFGKDNYGCIIYVIKEQGMGYGFFAEMRALLCNLLFAEELGLHPHIFWEKQHLYCDDMSIFSKASGFLAFTIEEQITKKGMMDTQWWWGLTRRWRKLANY